MDALSHEMEKLLEKIKEIENSEQLINSLSPDKLARLYNQICTFRLKKKIGGVNVTSFKFSQMTKVEATDQEGNPFDLYHVEFNYTTEDSDKVIRTVTLNTW